MVVILCQIYCNEVIYRENQIHTVNNRIITNIININSVE